MQETQTTIAATTAKNFVGLAQQANEYGLPQRVQSERLQEVIDQESIPVAIQTMLVDPDTIRALWLVKYANQQVPHFLWLDSPIVEFAQAVQCYQPSEELQLQGSQGSQQQQG